MVSGYRTVAFSLALAAMLLRGFLPAGWMPAGNDTVGIAICTGHGVVHSGSGHRGRTSPDRGDTVCPFAAAAQAAPVPSYSAMATPAATPRRVIRLVFANPLAVRRLLARHFPRAPPFLV